MKFEIVVRQGDRAYLNFSYTQSKCESLFSKCAEFDIKSKIMRNF